MTVIHIVLFKFLPTVPASHKSSFLTALRSLRTLPSVLNSSLLVGGPSITSPIALSKGFEYALVSLHKDRGALEEYQASDEHHRVTSEYLWPYKEDVTRFDFEVAEEDEGLCELLVKSAVGSVLPTPTDSHQEEEEEEEESL